jgi:hypothetical protein
MFVCSLPLLFTRSYLVCTGVATTTYFFHGKSSCSYLDPCADVLNLAIYYWLTFSEGGAYNIGYDERLRANRQFLTSVGSELRLTLHLMELVGWNLNYTALGCIENDIQVL